MHLLDNPQCRRRVFRHGEFRSTSLKGRHVMQRNLLSGLRTLTLGAVVVGMASVAANGAVIDGSFESYVLSDGNVTALPASAWLKAGGGSGYIYNPPESEMPAAQFDGANLMLMDTQVSDVTIYQVLSDTVDTSKQYELRFLVGRGNGTTLNDYLVSLYAGSNLVASVHNGAGGTGPSPAEGTMQEVVLPYNPQLADSGAFTIYFDNYNSSNTGLIYFDNVRLSEVAVPEPASIALLGLGASALVMRRRRQA
jgi:hypothetical protein